MEIEEPTFERYHDVPDRVRILVQVEADLHDNVIENLVNISKTDFQISGYYSRFGQTSRYHKVSTKFHCSPRYKAPEGPTNEP